VLYPSLSYDGSSGKPFMEMQYRAEGRKCLPLSGQALTGPLLGVVQIGVGGMIWSIQSEGVFRKGLDFLVDDLGPRQ
jgi:hypothetical protein